MNTPENTQTTDSSSPHEGGREQQIVRHFAGCKHLDYDAEYVDCTKEVASGLGVFWMRHNVPYPEAPKAVQFCKLRGRLNCMTACLGMDNAKCSEYHETQHEVATDA